MKLEFNLRSVAKNDNLLYPSPNFQISKLPVHLSRYVETNGDNSSIEVKGNWQYK